MSMLDAIREAVTTTASRPFVDGVLEVAFPPDEWMGCAQEMLMREINRPVVRSLDWDSPPLETPIVLYCRWGMIRLVPDGSQTAEVTP